MQRVARRLNAHPQFITEVDGLGIHHLHVRSENPEAVALILTHGWPGSVLEFLGVIDALREDFHLVIPSLPGYGWSAKPTAAGTGVERIAELWAGLMGELGYAEYFAQGGDWGAFVTAAMGQQLPPGLLGIHVNLLLADRKALRALGDITDEEERLLRKLPRYLGKEAGYAGIQSTKPQTLGYGLADSPVGQLAWIVEKFYGWTPARHPEDAFTRDELLDAVMVYWLTNSAASSARLYWEVPASNQGEVSIPSAYSAFPNDIFVCSERWARTRLTDLRYFSAPARGGHFAALEQPELFAAEVRAGIAAMRA
jgi:pimeloyl-ACP methyl ester carboxylesterase